MDIKKAPFNIDLVSTASISSLGTLPVTSMDIFDIHGNHHPRGIYSNEIFGMKGTPDRQKKESYIDIKITVLHPKFAIELFYLKVLYKGIMNGTKYAIWDNEIKDFVKSDILTGSTGYSFFLKHMKNIDFKRNGSLIRDLRIDFINKYMSKSLYDKVLVIPAGIRDIEMNSEGSTTEDDINAIYRSIIRTSNIVPIVNEVKDVSSLDIMRWKLQASFMELYIYIETLMAGKKGFARGKYASRNTTGGARNVITAMDPAPAKLGDKTAITVNDTVIGLEQYLMSTKNLSIHLIKTGYFKDIIESFPNMVPLIDLKTYDVVQVKPGRKTIDSWGTDDGIEKMINMFNAEAIKNDSILIEGHSPALIYIKDKTTAVIRDPSSLTKDQLKYVKPITWRQWFYLTVATKADDAVTYITRYPTTNTGSIYPSNVYMKSSVSGGVVEELDANLVSQSPVVTLKSFPYRNDKSFLSTSVHPSKEGQLGADHDGDTVSAPILESSESIKEAKNYLNSKLAYISPEGGLRYGVNSNTVKLVLHNLTKYL